MLSVFQASQTCDKVMGWLVAANRVMQAMFMLLEAQRWVDTTFPYWRRRAGRDHIWLITHDEGSCWAPKEIRSSIILSHWGRKDVNHTSNSAYLPWDNYTQEIVHPEWWPQGYTHHIRGHACYEPMKDLVIPNLKHPAEFANFSPLVGQPQPQRDILLLFRGDVGKARLPHYSRGIRQRLFRLAQEQKWAARHSILIGAREDIPGDYSELLSRAKFCLVAPGDGFSPRAEDAVLHGCVPVVVMDDVDPVFSSILHWSAFSIRIAEADMERLPQILLAVSDTQLQAMQRSLKSVWHRFMWSSLPIFNGIVRIACELNAVRANASAASLGAGCGDSGQDDAFATVMQWLSFKADALGPATVSSRKLLLI
ncbi:probable glucuronosyltransferase [Coccomyxa sp. Obi]|nr:probable glucuronosyltransferase [Coccomyxa sp. Obi]